MKYEYAKYFINVALEAAKLSNYKGTHVGCVLVKDNRIISTGVNGYSSKIDDDKMNKENREIRLKTVIHAEENAIINCAREGISTKGSIAFITHHPCISCIPKLINSGINYAVIDKNTELNDNNFKNMWLTEEDMRIMEYYKGLFIVDMID